MSAFEAVGCLAFLTIIAAGLMLILVLLPYVQIGHHG